MRPCCTLLLLAALLGPFFALYAAEPEPARDRAAELVTLLGSDEFQARQEAAQALDRLGAAALPALRKALDHPDAEVRRRAAEVLRVVERRVETARLLDAPRLRLQYKNVPLADVLADLSKRSGNPLKLDSSRKEVLKRPVTLDGEWTFWEALSRLCETAGLAEPETDPEPPKPPEIDRDFIVGRRRVIMESSQRKGPELEALVLHDLRPTARPTFVSGALRIRIFGPRVSGAVDKGLANQHAPLTLEVKPEPRIGWEKLAAVRIERVVDDRGSELKPPPVVLGEPRLPDYGDDVMVVWDGVGDPSSAPAPQRFTLQFPVSDRSRRLREVHGTVSGWIRTAPEPLISIDNLAKAVNQTKTGADGCRLKVAECQREDGLYKVRLELTPPQSPNAVDLLQGRIGRINGRAFRRVVEKASSSVDAATSPFVLSGEQGEALALVSGSCEYDSNGSSRVYEFVCKPDKNDKGPTKLVYRDRRSAFVEMPFTLRDVPLYKGK